jgi:hypothetical protein
MYGSEKEVSGGKEGASDVRSDKRGHVTETHEGEGLASEKP